MALRISSVDARISAQLCLHGKPLCIPRTTGPVLLPRFLYLEKILPIDGSIDYSRARVQADLCAQPPLVPEFQQNSLTSVPNIPKRTHSLCDLSFSIKQRGRCPGPSGKGFPILQSCPGEPQMPEGLGSTAHQPT